ncbi:HNH endonuclease [Kribbella shirazensis]|uniref:HNH nuclease domain-containing protein n=1 Tax=Kribbella shirazensis TaxID=1105143 RepID=A0A7X6A494_9ACTN|nr:HNH endonuclease signature motif containing protein [Kribbella shirazensis]NIK60770.1 hypothetical protein [Kribbella shirazensis]
MDVLGGRPVWSLADSELLPALDALDAEITRMQADRLQLIARVENTGYAQELGVRDCVELLSFRYRQDRAEAWRDVRLARALPRYAAVNTALAQGVNLPDEADSSDTEASESPREADREAAQDVRLLRPAHAVAIVSALERVRSRVPVEDLDIAEEQLVAMAAHLSSGELRSAAKQICDLLDSDGPEPEELKAYDRESLTLSTADHGVKFKGYLANENAELLRALIHAGSRPHKTVDGELDPRPRDKRQADALTTALTAAATAYDIGTAQETGTGAGATSAHEDTTWAGNARSGSAPVGAADAASGGAMGKAGGGEVRERVPGFGAKANITVTIDLHDLQAATADAIGETVYSGGLSAAAIRRLACDANVIPIVLGANSEPLDVGRRERLVTRAMRRALNTRDRGCVVCGAPPIMCDAHHLRSWLDGGETKVSNLVLLCRRHHVDLHNGRWTIAVTDGVVHVARPAWAVPPPLRFHRPPGSVLRAPGPSGATPTCPDPPTVNRGRETSIPVDDPWDETTSPAATTAATGISRWRADDATYAEAARFAVWGATPTNKPATGPPPFATV